MVVGHLFSKMVAASRLSLGNSKGVQAIKIESLEMKRNHLAKPFGISESAAACDELGNLRINGLVGCGAQAMSNPVQDKGKIVYEALGDFLHEGETASGCQRIPFIKECSGRLWRRSRPELPQEFLERPHLCRREIGGAQRFKRLCIFLGNILPVA